MTEISPDSSVYNVYCPNEKCGKLIGQLVTGISFFRCKNCRQTFRAETREVCRVEIVVELAGDKCNNLPEAA